MEDYQFYFGCRRQSRLFKATSWSSREPAMVRLATQDSRKLYSRTLVVSSTDGIGHNQEYCPVQTATLSHSRTPPGDTFRHPCATSTNYHTQRNNFDGFTRCFGEILVSLNRLRREKVQAAQTRTISLHCKALTYDTGFCVRVEATDLHRLQGYLFLSSLSR